MRMGCTIPFFVMSMGDKNTHFKEFVNEELFLTLLMLAKIFSCSIPHLC